MGILLHGGRNISLLNSIVTTFTEEVEAGDPENDSAITQAIVKVVVSKFLPGGALGG